MAKPAAANSSSEPLARNLSHRTAEIYLVVLIPGQLDDFHVLVEYLDIQAQRLHDSFNQNLEGLRYTRLRNVVTLDDCLVGLDTAGDIVRLNGQDLLQGVSGAVCFERPNFHLTETLAAELCLTTQRLLGNERVRTGRTCVNLIINQMVQLEVIHITNGNAVVKALTGTAVVQPALAVCIVASLDQHFLNVFQSCAVEYPGSQPSSPAS